MQNELLSTADAAKMTSDELRAFGALAPRQLSLFCTRYAAAKDAAQAGDQVQASLFLEAAKTAYRRSCEDERGQLMRVAAVQAVVEAQGAAQNALAPGGKNVVKLAMGRAAAVWQDSWYTR